MVRTCTSCVCVAFINETFYPRAIFIINHRLQISCLIACLRARQRRINPVLSRPLNWENSQHFRQETYSTKMIIWYISMALNRRRGIWIFRQIIKTSDEFFRHLTTTRQSGTVTSLDCIIIILHVCILNTMILYAKNMKRFLFFPCFQIGA